MISVVIPAYNAAGSLADCLRALQQQTCSCPYEIVVVDDGSSDDTVAVAEQWGAHVLRQTHRGPAAARNAGAKEARGDLVLFTDADCVPSTDWLAQLQGSLQDNRLTGVKGAYATHQREVIARLAQVEFEERYRRLEKAPDVDFIDCHSLSLRKAALFAVGGFDPSVLNNEDVDLAYRFAERGYRLAFNRRAIVYHRHPTTLRHYMRQKFWRGYWRMQVYRRYPKKMINDSYTPHTLKLQALLSPILVLSLGLVPLWPPSALLTLALCVILNISAISLYRLAWQQDRGLTPFIFWFVLCRGLAIGLGSILGLMTILHVMPILHTGAGQAAATVTESLK